MMFTMDDRIQGVGRSTPIEYLALFEVANFNP